MGCGVSKDSRAPMRVLVVGSSGCGKSTIVKQMTVRYKGGFGDEELEGKEIVRPCLVSSTFVQAFCL